MLTILLKDDKKKDIVALLEMFIKLLMDYKASVTLTSDFNTLSIEANKADSSN